MQMWKNCTCCKVGILFILTVMLQCKCIFFLTFKHSYFVYEYFMLPAFRCISTGDEGIKKIRELSVYREKWVEFFEVVPSEPHHYFYILVLYEMRNTESLAMYVCMYGHWPRFCSKSARGGSRRMVSLSLRGFNPSNTEKVTRDASGMYHFRI